MRSLVLLAWAQGLYFAATGLWAIVHEESFMLVTGPKTDVWLLKTVGMMILAVGLTILVAAARERISFEVALLAIASAVGLGAIDVIYATNGTIRDVYLLDAIVEAGLVLLWGILLWRNRQDVRLWGPRLGEGSFKKPLA